MIPEKQSTTTDNKSYFQIKSESYLGEVEKTTLAAKKAFPDLINILFNPVTLCIFIIFALVKPELLLTALIITFLFTVGIHCYRQHKIAHPTQTITN